MRFLTATGTLVIVLRLLRRLFTMIICFLCSAAQCLFMILALSLKHYVCVDARRVTRSINGLLVPSIVYLRVFMISIMAVPITVNRLMAPTLRSFRRLVVMPAIMVILICCISTFCSSKLFSVALRMVNVILGLVSICWVLVGLSKLLVLISLLLWKILLASD